MNKQLTTTALLLACTLFASCIDGQDDDRDSDGPILIDDELLQDNFAECELDIDACLENDEVLSEIERRIEDGVWAWPDTDDAELGAAGTYLIYRCAYVSRSKARALLASTCRYRGARLISGPWLHGRCNSGNTRWQGWCRK